MNLRPRNSVQNDANNLFIASFTVHTSWRLPPPLHSEERNRGFGVRSHAVLKGF